MIEGIRRWWGLRTTREQRLLLVMIALLAVTILWLAVYRPVEDALSRARVRHADAVLALARAEADGAAFRAILRTQPTALGMPLTAFVESSAAQAGFTPSLAAQGEGRISVTLPSARPPALFAWIAELEARGVVVETLSASANADPTVSATITLTTGVR